MLNKWKFFFCVDQILFNLACHHGKSFVAAFFFFCFFFLLFKVSIDHLFDNLESGKRSFGKSLEKVLNFGSKICMNPVSKSRISTCKWFLENKALHVQDVCEMSHYYSTSVQCFLTETVMCTSICKCSVVCLEITDYGRNSSFWSLM